MSVLAHKWVSSGALQGQAAFAKARVVVSLHGIMGQGRNWMTAARQLVKRQPNHKVLLVDLRGHGANATIAGPHTVAAAARDVAETIKHACGPDAPTPSEPTALLADGTAPLVLGHSFGGKVGLAYASTPAWQSTSEVPVTSRRWRGAPKSLISAQVDAQRVAPTHLALRFEPSRIHGCRRRRRGPGDPRGRGEGQGLRVEKGRRRGQCGNQPVRQAGLKVLFTILAASTQRESA